LIQEIFNCLRAPACVVAGQARNQPSDDGGSFFLGLQKLTINRLKND